MSDTSEMTGPDLIDRAMESDEQKDCDAAVARIEEKARAVKRTLDKGVSPTDFKRLNSVHDALIVSTEVMKRAWLTAKTKRAKGA